MSFIVNRKTLLLNFILFSAILCSIIAIRQLIQEPTTQIAPGNTPPDAYMLDVVYMRTNDQGYREVVMRSPHVIHYNEHNTSDFQMPNITIFNKRQNWLITAQTGHSVNGTEIVYLNDNVQIHQQPTDNSPTTLFKTAELTIFPKQNRISTEQSVLIEQPGVTITGEGLKGDLTTGNIKLLSNTRGRYDPKQHQ
jgi:lipopolysaccharide export system protein LptC